MTPTFVVFVSPSSFFFKKKERFFFEAIPIKSSIFVIRQNLESGTSVK